MTPEEYRLEQKHEIFTRLFVSKIVKLDGKLGDLQDKEVRSKVSVMKYLRWSICLKVENHTRFLKQQGLFSHAKLL